jgi:uncharacterized protein
MPVNTTYPGIHVEEISSGVRTITGVATSNTAFIGRAARGPTDEPVTINSFGDFECIFGGMCIDFPLGYAIRDFYLNGGSTAIVVRLFHPTFASEAERGKAVQAASDTAAAATGINAAAAVASAKTKAGTFITDPDKTAAKKVADAADAAGKAGATADDVQAAARGAVATAAPRTTATLTVGGLALAAMNQGSWGNNLSAAVDLDVMGDDAANLFNLTVQDTKTGAREVFRNVSHVSGHVRQIDKVLTTESRLVVMSGSLPGSRPTAGTATVADGDNATDGTPLVTNDFMKEGTKQGLYSLENADLFNILCIPPYLAQGQSDSSFIDTAAQYCEKRRAMLLLDPPVEWTDKDKAMEGVDSVGAKSKNAAVFFPRLRQPDPLRDGQVGDFVPCGAVAGLFARTDTNRGVWEAPAGLDATLVGVPELSVALTDLENNELSQRGVNCLRALPAARRVVWGARTRLGDDRLASEWKYIPVRRTALFIEESLYRGTQWVVFEPNDEPLWSQVRLNIGAFVHNLFRQGAFQGKTPQEAYFVKCDKETTTQNDVNLGVVNIVVGFAPLKPAEFVIIKVQQIAGQTQT